MGIKPPIVKKLKKAKQKKHYHIRVKFRNVELQKVADHFGGGASPGFAMDSFVDALAASSIGNSVNVPLPGNISAFRGTIKK